MLLLVNLAVDLIILLAFLAVFQPDLTGIPFHEWFSLVLTGIIILHLLLHWRWMVSVSIRFFKKIFHSSRLDYVVDGLLFITFTVAILSGLLISRVVMINLGLPTSPEPVWLELHDLSANLTLILTGLHIALHWKWVASTFARYFIHPVKIITRRLTTITVPHDQKS